MMYWGNHMGTGDWIFSIFGTLLILVLSSDLHWLDLNAPDWTTGDVLADPAALILPTLTLAIGTVALFSRYLRASTVEELAKDYITTARAKGASRSRVSSLPFISSSPMESRATRGRFAPQMVR